MDCLTFITKVLEFGAWPIVVLAVVYIFRKDLVGIFSTITKLKAGPVELERVVQELKETKKLAVEAAGKANFVAARFDESDETASNEIVDRKIAVEHDESIRVISEIERNVLKAMVNSPYVTRSITGVAKDSGLDKSAVQVTYGALIAKGLVEQTTNNDGKNRWAVTSLGRQIIN
nr:hypothetical protein [uncultured Duganella sp.]